MWWPVTSRKPYQSPEIGPSDRRTSTETATRNGSSNPSATRAIPAGRAAGTGDAQTSNQRWNAGTSASAANGLTTQTATDAMARTSDSAAPAPGLSGGGSLPARSG